MFNVLHYECLQMLFLVKNPVLTAASVASARSALACESMLSLATQIWHFYSPVPTP